MNKYFILFLSITIVPTISAMEQKNRSEWQRLPSMTTQYSMTELFIKAASNNDLALVQGFVDSGIDVNTHDTFGITALMRAAQAGNIEIVRLLLQAGANVNSTTTARAQTALMMASGKFEANNDIVTILIGAGANVDAQNDYGATALVLAAAFGNMQVTRTLIKAGANVNIKKNNHTALQCAALNGHTEIAKILIDAGANVNITDKLRRTILTLAKDKGHDDIAEILEAADAI